MVRCSQCGHENRDGAKFCAHCQASLAQSPISEVSEVVGQSPRLRMAVSIIVGIICLVYLINPTAGVLELIPDNLPIVGNLDEAAAMTVLLVSLSNLGLINKEWVQSLLGLRRQEPD
jgi:uncharacterized membrane protein YkvA (DUF1232 family)